MDLRLTALTDKLADTFNKATGATCSPEDLTYLAKFSQHFGATNIGYVFRQIYVIVCHKHSECMIACFRLSLHFCYTLLLSR